MPWKKTNVQKERVRFIGYYLADEHSITDICKLFGISRKTGYKLINSFMEHGLEGLKRISLARRTPTLMPLLQRS